VGTILQGEGAAKHVTRTAKYVKVVPCPWTASIEDPICIILGTEIRKGTWSSDSTQYFQRHGLSKLFLIRRSSRRGRSLSLFISTTRSKRRQSITLEFSRTCKTLTKETVPQATTFRTLSTLSYPTSSRKSAFSVDVHTTSYRDHLGRLQSVQVSQTCPIPRGWSVSDDHNECCLNGSTNAVRRRNIRKWKDGVWTTLCRMSVRRKNSKDAHYFVRRKNSTNARKSNDK